LYLIKYDGIKKVLSSLFLQANVCKINENNRFYQYFPGMFLGFSPNALFQILVTKKANRCI